MEVSSEIFLKYIYNTQVVGNNKPIIFSTNNCIEKTDWKSELWSEKYKPAVRNALKNSYIPHELTELHAL